jgi:hypothetical protein
MVRELKQIHEDWQLAPVRDLILLFLGEEEDAWQRTVRVPIPADLGMDRGSVVTLVLESRARGLGEFYPNPPSMAFLHADMEFQEAHEHAWVYARRWHDGHTDVRWTLSHPSCHFLEVRGASAGAGFALGLMHLLDLSRSPLGREWAITGDVNEEGKVQAVNGFPAKLQGACFKGYKVIVPSADLARLLVSEDGRRPVMEGVRTMERASMIVSKLLDAVARQVPHQSHPSWPNTLLPQAARRCDILSRDC